MTDSQLDFPDLAAPAADAAEPPAYDDLVGRAGRRRRTQALGAVTAAAAAVALVVAVTTAVGGRPVSQGPVDGPTPTDPTPARALLTAEQVVAEGLLAGVADSDDGSLTLWRHCRRGFHGCQYAWRLEDGASSTGLLPGDGVWNATAAGDRFVITDGSSSGGGLVVDRSGRATSIRESEPGPISDDVVLVFSRGRETGFDYVDAARAVRWPLARPDDVERWDSAALGADHSVWAMAAPEPGDQEVGLWHSLDGGATWSRRALTVGDPVMPAYIVAAGENVAALASYDGATVLPVGDLAITSDGGTSWTDLARADVPFAMVDTMAATEGGTLYVVGGALQGGLSLRLYRSTDATWTHFAEVPMPDGEQVNGVMRAGSTVFAETGSEDDSVDRFVLGDGVSPQPWTTPVS